MSKRLTLHEWIFALGIYPSLRSEEKHLLFIEMIQTYIEEIEKTEEVMDSKKMKFIVNKTEKLSEEKKASFVSFLQGLDTPLEMFRYEEAGINWVTILSNNYPTYLHHIYNPPIILFYIGQLNLTVEKNWLGVVGTREASKYGQDVTNKIISSLMTESNGSVGVISGLGKGIARVAHQSALGAGGNTIAVIGTGLDQFYPASNRLLQEEIAKNHLLISEYPMGAKPLKYHFPERNRIIVGLSRGILVIEAQRRSASLMTAYRAIDENREVFVVPGSIFDSGFEGSHRLIQLGAFLTEKSEDILREWTYL